MRLKSNEVIFLIDFYAFDWLLWLADSRQQTADSRQQTADSRQCSVHRSFAILRPTSDGSWFIQSDIDHMPSGISDVVEQSSDYINIFFSRAYTHAGVVSISSDDGFNVSVTGHANLGLNAINIHVFCGGVKIDPSKVWDCSGTNVATSNGNFWVQASMLNCQN